MQITMLRNISRDASFGLNAKFSKGGKVFEPRPHELFKVFEFEVSVTLLLHRQLALFDTVDLVDLSCPHETGAEDQADR